MLNQHQRRCLAAAALALPSPLAAFAGEGITGSVAAGVASRPDYEGSADNEIAPLFAADITYKGVTLSALGDDLELDISPYENLSFGPAVSFRNGRNTDIGNEVVSWMTEIDDAVEVGAFARYAVQGVLSPRDRVVLGTEFLTDVSDSHEGYVLSLGASYSRQLTGRLGAGISIGSSYASDDYMDTYFGVDAADAALTGFDPYSAEAGFKDVSLSLSTQYDLTGTWSVLGIYSYRQLTGDSADSPVVAIEGDDAQHRFGVGLKYRF